MAVGFDPIPRKELYLDVITGGDSELPEPLTREEKYLGKIAGMSVDIPEPLTRYEQYLYAIANGDTLTLKPIPRLEMYLAKACGQDTDVPEPITREEKYWFDYINGGKRETIEYTGAVPVTIYANGEPLIEMIISGNMSQSGTPTPTTTIQPSETGDMSDNILTVYKENYSINASGMETYNNVAMIYKAEVAVTGSTFTLNFGGLLAGDTVRIHSYTGNTWQEQVNAINIEQVPYSFTVGSNIDNIRISIRKTATDVTMTDGQYKIPISSANTTTPVYLGEVETTRQVKKVVFDGTENWFASTAQSGRFGLSLSDYLKANGTITSFCSHYTAIAQKSSGAAPNNSQYFYSGSDVTRYIFIVDERYTTADAFKAYLAQQYANGTPVTVWYVLASPTTGIVNEPLRKIGNYADSLSLPEGVSIPTVEGENVIDVETTLKPSEIYLKYKGRSNS